MPRAVILLSGGLDSATVAALARGQGFELHALTFAYGQRHAAELDAARRVARASGTASHRVVELDPRAFHGSALTSGGAPVPKDRVGTEDDTGGEAEIPATYVPARNTIFLAYALGFGEVIGASDLFLGANAVDYSGYPDCRPEFLAAFEALANLATRSAVQEGLRWKVHAPLLHLSKAEIVRRGVALGVDYATTVSCYDADEEGRACGRCDSCHFRRLGFERAGLADPTRYRPREVSERP